VKAQGKALHCRDEVTQTGTCEKSFSFCPIQSQTATDMLHDARRSTPFERC